MTSTSTTSRSKAKKTSNMLVKGVKWTAPNFKLVPAIAESLDPSGAQSIIPSKAAIPRVAWVKPLPYEINIDEARDIIEALINEPAIPNTPAFGTYDEAKARIELEIKLPKAITSTKRKAAKTEETEEESEEEAETPKKKGKVVITKPKPKTTVFTRKTRKGQKESEVLFRRPPPTFEEKLKQLEQGSGMSNFKALKYESRSDAEKMQIEEFLLNKMGKWKYTPDDISSQIPNELLVAAEVIASLPHSPQKGVASLASASRISVASTEQQVTSSVTEITTSPAACIVSFATSPVLTHSFAQMITPISTPACTSILETVGKSIILPLVNPILVITASPTLSTIVTTSKDKEVSTEVIQKTPLKLLLTGKAIEDDIDLDKEIVIPQIDLNTASIDEMRLISQMLEQKAKQKQLRSERDREFNIINSAKTILTNALGIKVDPSQHILLQLEEAVNRFNEDSLGEEKLIERTEKKFDNKVLEHIAQQIAIKQVELTTILAKLENSFNNITSFCAKLCDVTQFTKGIRDQLKKIDDDMKASAQ
ncbi:hypothetical protein SUGI_0696410 [Cryptomeria japonica]|nr:hypothetical protein SUGI_0696410 [Cryptomeria japonica]